MSDRQEFIDNQLDVMRENIRLYEISTSIRMRDLAAERMVHAFKMLDEAGVFGPDEQDPDAPVPYTLTDDGMEVRA